MKAALRRKMRSLTPCADVYMSPHRPHMTLRSKYQPHVGALCSVVWSACITSLSLYLTSYFQRRKSQDVYLKKTVKKYKVFKRKSTPYYIGYSIGIPCHCCPLASITACQTAAPITFNWFNWIIRHIISISTNPSASLSPLSASLFISADLIEGDFFFMSDSL